jgi:hypothetical protein
MSNQNIRFYGKGGYELKKNNSNFFDLTLAPDEQDYDTETIFSTSIIADDDGNRLPINIDLNSTDCSEKQDIEWGDKNMNVVVVSKNIYNPNDDDFSCLSSTTLCDVGLTAIDVGLYSAMTGQSLTFTMGVNDFEKFNPHYYDRRLKMRSIGSYATNPNERFSGNSNTIYNIVSKTGDNIGYYNELYGGYFQGFYKLHGYDYEVFPERVNHGWTTELLLKPRQRDEFNLGQGEYYLNQIYPENSGTFFFFGTRSENKFFEPNDALSGCVKTCGCANTGETNSDCFGVFPTPTTTDTHQSTDCGMQTIPIQNPETDPLMDVYSNAMSLRFEGDPRNPKICVKYIKMTGDCITTGSCETTGITYQSGYTIQEICSVDGIYDNCNYDDDLCITANTEERWVMVSCVFERNSGFNSEEELLSEGGLGLIRECKYPSEMVGQSYNIIAPPNTHPGSEGEKLQNLVEINRKWLDEANKRMGTLKIYINGFQFMVIEDFEEIIPRELNTQKEKQIGVPFNISWGGGSFGLRESLMFSGCPVSGETYVQQPNLMSETTLEGGLFSSSTIVEETFGGTFMGGISQFRMYVEPLDFTQIRHNYNILKDDYDLYDRWCSNCYPCLYGCYFDFNAFQY